MCLFILKAFLRRKQSPQSHFPFFSWDLPKTKYLGPFLLIYEYKFHFLIPEKKKQVSSKHNSTLAFIHLLSTLSCVNISGRAKHRNGCVTDGTSDSSHVPKSGMKKYLMKNSISCYGFPGAGEFLKGCICCVLSFFVALGLGRVFFCLLLFVF